MAVLDSYSESNSAGDADLYNGTTTKLGQSWNYPTADVGVTSAKFFVAKVGSPTGNVTAALYAHTGTYGSTGMPTGAALATSNNIDVSTISTTQALVEFTFASPYTITAGVNYVITIEYAGGSASNKLVVGKDFTSSSHDGNLSLYVPSAWDVIDTQDLCFYVYGAGSSPSSSVSSSASVSSSPSSSPSASPSSSPSQSPSASASPSSSPSASPSSSPSQSPSASASPSSSPSASPSRSPSQSPSASASPSSSPSASPSSSPSMSPSSSVSPSSSPSSSPSVSPSASPSFPACDELELETKNNVSLTNETKNNVSLTNETKLCN